MKVQMFYLGQHDEPVQVAIEPNIIVSVEETDTLAGKSVAQIDIMDENGNRCRFFIAAGRKNGRSFCRVSHNRKQTSVSKEVFGTFKTVEKPAMRVLEIELNGKTEQIQGRDKTACLGELRNRLEKFDFNSVVIHTGYKEKRGLYTRTHARIDLEMEPENSSTQYVIDITENGGGEYEEFDDRQKAIDRFMRIAEEKGEHWD